MKNQTRRKFIIDGAKIIVTVICIVILGQGLLFAQTPEASNIQFPESNCGSKNKGDHKILIAYASESGSTAEVAKAIVSNGWGLHDLRTLSMSLEDIFLKLT